MRYGIKVIIAAVMVICVTACDTSTDSAGANQPAAEAAFLAARSVVESAYNDAPNDIVKSRIYDEWQNKGSCAAVKTGSFTNWTGSVSKIEKADDVDKIFVSHGKNGAIFEVNPADQVTLSGFVDQASPAYKVIETLQVGQAVTFSGTFDPGACSSTGGLLHDGAIERPEFDVHFSHVSPQSE